MRTRQPVKNEVNVNQLHFPFNLRCRCSAGTCCSSRRRLRNSGPRARRWNRGAYLVRGRPLRRLPHADQRFFGGASKERPGPAGDQWTAGPRQNLTNDKRTGLGKWTAADIVAYLKTGPETAPASQRPDEGSGRELDLEDEGWGSQGDRGLSERKRSGRLGSPAPLPAADPRMQVGEAIFIDPLGLSCA